MFSARSQTSRSLAAAVFATALGSVVAPPFVAEATNVITFDHVVALGRAATGTAALQHFGHEPATPLGRALLEAAVRTPVAQVQLFYGMAFVLVFTLSSLAIAVLFRNARGAALAPIFLATCLEVRASGGPEWSSLFLDAVAFDASALGAVLAGLAWHRAGGVRLALAAGGAGALLAGACVAPLGGVAASIGLLVAYARTRPSRPAARGLAAVLAAVALVAFSLPQTLLHVGAALPIAYRAYGDVIRDGITPSQNDDRFGALAPVGLTPSIAIVVAGLLVLWLVRRPSAAADAAPDAALVPAACAALAALAGACAYAPAEAPLETSGAVLFVDLAFAGVAVWVATGRGFPRTRIDRGAVAAGCAVLCAFGLYGNVQAGTAVSARAFSAQLEVPLLLGAAREGVFDELPPGADLHDATRPSGLATFDDGDARVFLQTISHRTAGAGSPGARAWLVNVTPERHGASIVAVAQFRGYLGARPLVGTTFALRTYDWPWTRDERVPAHPPSGDAVIATRLGARQARIAVHDRCAPVPLDAAVTEPVPQVVRRTGLTPYVYAQAPFVFAAGDRIPTDREGARRWRTAGNDSSILVRGLPCDRHRYELALDVFTAAPALVTLRTETTSTRVGAGEAGGRLVLAFTLDSRGEARFALHSYGPPARDNSFTWRVPGERTRVASVLTGPITIAPVTRAAPSARKT